ncbi:MAG: transporter substrate-binding domain-containing protein, partial [Peptostreptococcaceae bacterium]|nr:transporter substrate-binding domain-containing protein [Peptostreptococcaceae bacterium]
SPDYPPYEFKTIKDGKLEIVGFEVEMAKKFAEKLGVDLEIKEMDFKLVIESVKKGEADIAMAGISPTPQRAEQVGMTEGYYKSEQTALIRAEDVDKYTSKDSLKGKNIGAQMGAIQVKIAQSVDGATVKELPLVTALLADLKTKKIDAIVMESAVAKQYAMGNPEFKVANFVFESDSKSSVLAVKKENTDLLEFLNKEIEQMISDGTVNKLVVDAMDITEAK